jgi:hypothetical protein
MYLGTLEDGYSLDAILSTILADAQGELVAGSGQSRMTNDAEAGEQVPDAALTGARRPDGGGKKVWLLPLLSTIGKHAEQDMAGDHPASWRGRIEAAGLICRPVLKGTVEYAGFAGIWLEHLARAMARLRG